VRDLRTRLKAILTEARSQCVTEDVPAYLAIRVAMVEADLEIQIRRMEALVTQMRAELSEKHDHE
jgi:hypothetical protein